MPERHVRLGRDRPQAVDRAAEPVDDAAAQPVPDGSGADAAHALGDDVRAAARLDEVKTAELSPGDQDAISDALDRADELRASLAEA